MMREIKVGRNASVYAYIGMNTIDVEIRTTKDSYRGMAVHINSKCVFDLAYNGEGKFIVVKSTDAGEVIG